MGVPIQNNIKSLTNETLQFSNTTQGRNQMREVDNTIENFSEQMGDEYKRTNAKILAVLVSKKSTGACIQFDGGIVDFCYYDYKKDLPDLEKDEYTWDLETYTYSYKEWMVDTLPHDTIVFDNHNKFINFVKIKMEKYIDTLSIFKSKYDLMLEQLKNETGISLKDEDDYCEGTLIDRIKNAKKLLAIANS